jgi:hypothetical protein
LTHACFCTDHRITYFLLRNDPLDAVWREAEKGLHFVRKARFQGVAAVIVSQQRFIATMQGRTSSFSTFSDAQFDEAAFEAHLARNCNATIVCLYWIIKLKARFLSGDYADALAAAEWVKAVLSASPLHIQLVDYFYYRALTVAALYEKGSADEQKAWGDLLAAHQQQLRELAENYPPTFGDKHALVSAEIARLEGRAFDAMQLYEHAIWSAHENGFVQNEGTAHEVAARFYAARGFEKIAHLYLRDARYCYLQWGAHGKVKQLDERYPHLQEERPATSGAAPIGAPIAQLDVETVVKASQAVSGEIVLENLIKTLMVTAVEHAGAERGLLILPRGDQLWVEAEATTGLGPDGVELRALAALPRQEWSISLAAISSPSRLLGAQETTSDSPGFRQALGASRRCNSGAWRDCSISFGGTCRKPTVGRILIRRHVWARRQWPLKRRSFGWPVPRRLQKLPCNRERRSSLSLTSILPALRSRPRLSGVSTIETDVRFSGREDFWIIVAARSEDETEIRAGKAAGGRRDQGHSARDASTFFS